MIYLLIVYAVVSLIFGIVGYLTADPYGHYRADPWHNLKMGALAALIWPYAAGFVVVMWIRDRFSDGGD
jgi:hypothetical protein